MADEVELKFDVAPECGEAIRSTPVLAAAVAHGHESASLYFDTKNGALRKAGLSLRVRRSGGRIVQTVKRKPNSAAGLFVRDEWETELSRFRLDLDALEPKVRRMILAKADGHKLKPAVRTRFSRTSWNVDRDGSRIEVVLDEGEVSAGRAHAPLTELELELKHGKADALFALAQEVAGAVPLRLGTMSKSERGYALADGQLESAAKAEPVRLTPEMSEGEAFTAIARACLRHFRLNETVLLARRDPDALHQARVALRRLRSAMTLFRHGIRGKDYQALREELRWFAGQLGEARNLDVLSGADAPAPFRDDAKLSTALRAARDEAYADVMAALESERTRALMLKLARWLELGRWREKPRAASPVLALAADRLDRQWRKVRRRGEDLGHLDADAEHQLRIDIKKLRYAAEFLAGLYADPASAKRVGRFVSALKDLQEELGVANDARTANAVAARLAPETEMPPPPPANVAKAEKCFRRAAAASGYWETPA